MAHKLSTDTILMVHVCSLHAPSAVRLGTTRALFACLSFFLRSFCEMRVLLVLLVFGPAWPLTRSSVPLSSCSSRLGTETGWKPADRPGAKQAVRWSPCIRTTDEKKQNGHQSDGRRMESNSLTSFWGPAACSLIRRGL